MSNAVELGDECEWGWKVTFLCIKEKMIPPNNVFDCKTHKCILTIKDSQTTHTLRNIEWGPTLRWGEGSILPTVIMSVKLLC